MDSSNFKYFWDFSRFLSKWVIGHHCSDNQDMDPAIPSLVDAAVRTNGVGELGSHGFASGFHTLEVEN